MDWNSDGRRDLVSGDRNGFFNVFIADSSGLTAYYAVNLANGDTFDVGANSQPAVTDWDLDGRKDLIMGNEAGEVRLYLNVGTDTAPAFQDYSLISCNGTPISFNRVNPYIFDLDRDGRRDLICGANDGYVHFFRNTGSDTNPSFSAEETLRDDNGNFIVPSGTAVGSRMGFGDWNNDGWPDILISGYSGNVDLYMGGPATSVAESPNQGMDAALSARPNPARSRVAFDFSLPRSGKADLSVFDAQGRRVCRLLSGQASAGPHSLTWNAKCPAGAYLCRPTVDDRVLTRQVTLLAR